MQSDTFTGTATCLRRGGQEHRPTTPRSLPEERGREGDSIQHNTLYQSSIIQKQLQRNMFFYGAVLFYKVNIVLEIVKNKQCTIEQSLFISASSDNKHQTRDHSVV